MERKINSTQHLQSYIIITVTQCGNPSVLLNSFWNCDLIGQFSSRDQMRGRANAASQYATCAICGLTGSFIQQIVPNVFAYLRLKKHVSNSNSCESLIYMNKERGLAKKVVWYDHSHDTRNLLYGFPHCATYGRSTALASQIFLAR